MEDDTETVELPDLPKEKQGKAVPEKRRSETPKAGGALEPQAGQASADVTLTIKDESKIKSKQKVANYLLMPEMNKATISYFGSEEAVKKEKNRAEGQEKFVIHPYSSFRKYWLVLMLLITFINVLIIPLGVSFFTEEVQSSAAWIAFNVISDVIFISDLSLNFCIGYTSDDADNVVLDKKMIRNRYFKSWFIPDLLAVTPVDYCLLISTAAGAIYTKPAGYSGVRMMRMLKLTRVFSLLRLFRFSRLLRYARYWEEVHGWNVGGIAVALHFSYMLLIIILLCHWNACIQFLVAMLMEFPENSWVTIDGLVDKPIGLQYSKAMFRALCHMMTLNYGSVGIPRGISEVWVVILSMLVGAVMYTLVLARLTSLVTHSAASERVFDSKYNEVKEYMRHHHLPSKLRNRIMDYLENRYQGKWFDEETILKELSEPLRQEIVSYNCQSLVSNMPVFKDADPHFITALLEVLQFEMYETGDDIIRKGAFGDCMYFIDRGTVLVQAPNLQQKLTDGAFFGELCLIRDGKRTASVKALTPCRLYSLSVTGYRKVLQQFPELQAQIEKVAIERLKILEDAVKTEKPC
nr:PREDICTED: potassium/sodium hyperpolarization-activated cyclic nucleotide-gated channel 1-like [Lepisosteus oculatus]